MYISPITIDLFRYTWALDPASYSNIEVKRFYWGIFVRNKYNSLGELENTPSKLVEAFYEAGSLMEEKKYDREKLNNEIFLLFFCFDFSSLQFCFSLVSNWASREYWWICSTCIALSKWSASVLTRNKEKHNSEIKHKKTHVRINPIWGRGWGSKFHLQLKKFSFTNFGAKTL